MVWQRNQRVQVASVWEMRAGVPRRGSKQQLFVISFFLSFDTGGLSFFISQGFIETFFHFFSGFLYSSLNSLMPIIYGAIQYTSVKNGNYDDFCLSITYLELWLMFIMCVHAYELIYGIILFCCFQMEKFTLQGETFCVFLLVNE